MARGYRELPHTADVALEIWGHDLPEFFAHAAQGLFSLLVTVKPGAPVSQYREIRLSAQDLETLLVDWLNELLSLYDECHEAFIDFNVLIPRLGELAAAVGGTQAFTPRITVKAATFHDLAVRREPGGGYRTVVIFDV